MSSSSSPATISPISTVDALSSSDEGYLAGSLITKQTSNDANLLKSYEASIQKHKCSLLLSTKAITHLKRHLNNGPRPSTAFEFPADATPSESDASLLVLTSLLSSLLTSFEQTAEPDQEQIRFLFAEIIHNFEITILNNLDIHTVAESLGSPDARKTVLRVYYAALAACRRRPRIASQNVFEQTDLSTAKQTVALFAGQGMSNADCLKQLRSLWQTYRPLLHALIATADITLSDLSSKDEVADVFSEQPFPLLQWLDDAEHPIWSQKDMLATTPYSVPLIGLVGLANYVIACRVSSKDPAQVRNTLKSALGHSQGVLVAAVVAMADSWDSFYKLVRDACQVLFWIGYESHCATYGSELSAKDVEDSLENSEGTPSHMLSVRGLSRSSVESILTKINAHLEEEEQATVALENSRDNVVVSGSPSTLRSLALQFRRTRLAPGADQSKIPFDKRKPIISVHFIPSSAPFHNSQLDYASARVQDHLRHIKFDGSRLAIPVLGGYDLTGLPRDSIDVVPAIVESIMCRSANFSKICTSLDAVNVVDFGPDGLTSLVLQLTEGTGTNVVNANFTNPSGLLHADDTSVNWLSKFAPHVITNTDGETSLDNKFTRTFGKQPVLAAGMTPTSVSTKFVSAVINAGFHAELACGGYNTPEELEAAIRQICCEVPLGQSICLNIIYASPHAVKWQIPLIKRLNEAGLPIEGLAIGAGVPTSEVIQGYIETLGIKYICFKPGTIQSIADVIAVAKDHPTFQFMVQWTGGRGGGHHSYEDMHEPIVKMYGKLRACENLTLVAGSGFGDAQDSYPYLSGQWSVTFDYPAMPFDAILMGSRLMVCEEASTSPACKQLIVDTKGVGDKDWSLSYSKPAGGILTVNSEMGQPIHKIATRGVQLWAQLDKEYFSLKPAEMLLKLQSNKAWVIKQLNENYQKVWFPVAADSEGVAELEDMTYQEVVERLIELMYVASEHRWVHKSFHAIVVDFLDRIAARAGVEYKLENDSPQAILACLKSMDDFATTQQLNPQDSEHFVALCRVKGRKPVNFIPVLDQEFQSWFKKDSLWYSEDLAAVPGQDAGRVCILQGPVGVEYATKVDEPIGTVLKDINGGLIERAANDFGLSTSGSESLPREWEGVQNLGNSIFQVRDDKVRIGLRFDQASISTEDWEAWIQASPLPITFKAFFAGEHFCRGSVRSPNINKSVFAPRKGLRYEFMGDIDGDRWMCGLYEDSECLLKLTSTSSKSLEAVVKFVAADSAVQTELRASYSLTQGAHPSLVQSAGAYNIATQKIYEDVWANAASTAALEVVTVNETHARAFMTAVGYKPQQLRRNKPLPLDYAITLIWPALMAPLFAKDLDADLLRLVHLSNSFRVLEDDGKIFIGDKVRPVLKQQSVTVQSGGKLVEVVAVLEKDNKPLIEVTSAFLCRGTYSDHTGTEKNTTHKTISLHVANSSLEALLRSKTWLRLHSSDAALRGKTLIFEPSTRVTYRNATVFETLTCSGPVYAEHIGGRLEEVGTIAYTTHGVKGNKVVSFLHRHGKELDTLAALEKPGHLGSLTLRLPSSNGPYSSASFDHNPIHTSATLAQLAGHEDAITHGMNISARVRLAVSKIAGSTSFALWQTEFTGKSFASNTLRVDVRHTGMHAGRKVLSVAVFNETTGAPVMKATAELAQPETAYVFTGQGSQEKGMGMALYASSAAAKAVWDEADAAMLARFGWSLLHVVRENPTSLTIHFGGPAGKAIRARYLAMTIERTQPDGTRKTVPSVPGLSESASSHTFADPRGLLFSTQFAQPALTVMELATFAALRERQLVPARPVFAGHSLGEYGALVSVADFMSVSALVDLAFYRGSTMASAVEKDDKGLTDYGMLACNPSRVSRGFTQEALQALVARIATLSSNLLEIVNFNIEGQQYVCAGTLRNLATLSAVMDVVARTPLEGTQLDEVIQKTLESTPSRPTLVRRPHAVPLQGIDVPFHSSALLSGVSAYRKHLFNVLDTEHVRADKLVGTWVPNVMAERFELSRDFAERVMARTGAELGDVVAALA